MNKLRSRRFHAIVAEFIARGVGIAGTIILIIIWAITRMPGNPITGRGGPIGETAIATEIFQIAYVIITSIIIVKERRGHIRSKSQG